MRRGSLMAMLACLLLCAILAGCVPTANPPESPESPPPEATTPAREWSGWALPEFAAETAYELHLDEPGYRKVDVVFPKVVGVPNASTINARLAEDFVISEDGPWVAEGYPYTYSEMWYSVSNQGGICSLDILTRVTSLERPDAIPYGHVISYYYDMNTKQVIPTRQEYLIRLWVDENDIRAAFNARYGDAYDGLVFPLDSPYLWYYFDEAGELVFFMQMLDYMAAQRDALYGHRFVRDGAPDRAAIAAAYAEHPQDTARELAELYADVIRYGADIDVVGWEGEFARAEANKVAAFELLFDRNGLFVIEPRLKENYVDTYECEITGTGPYGQRRVPLLISFSPDARSVFYCPLPLYAERCFEITEDFFDLLRGGDAGALSAWLSIDGGTEYFRAEAEELLDDYARYDLRDTRIARLDFDIERDCFVMYAQDALGRNFRVPLSYDGIFVLPNFRAILRGEWATPLGDTEYAELVLGASRYFTRAELEAAAECVKQSFVEMTEDCVLLRLEYDEAYADEQYPQYMEYGRGRVTGVAREDYVIFQSLFEVGELAHIATRESGGGWRWTLIRDGADGAWRLSDKGY